MSTKKLYNIWLPLCFILTMTFSCVPEEEGADCSSVESSTTCETNEEDGETEEVNEGEDSTEDNSDETDDDTTEDTGDSDTDDGNNEEYAQEPTETITESFSSPWNKSENTIIIDAYQGNSIDWDQMDSDPNVAAVIHRSSIGQRVDTKYVSRKNEALSRGYLWGAYHLGYKGNTIAQANLFLDLINNEKDTLMILDLEDTSNGTFMTINEAIVFMEYVYDKTGRIPVVYANHSTTIKLNQTVAAHPLFQQAKLWYARFKSRVTDFPFGIWNNYFMWQFSSEINCNSTGSCLYNVPGTRYDMDVNTFYGTRGDLQARWHNY